MDQTIMSNYNRTIQPNDTVFFLGDLAFNIETARTALKSMNGTIIYILGNHDTKIIPALEEHCDSVHKMLETKIENQLITLCHYAMRVWHHSHFNSWQLYAHSHGRLPPVGKQWDVGIDNNKFRPISFEEITSIMKTLPNNENYIEETNRN
jgi:calcineurin-like phosphoesterase family protein